MTLPVREHHSLKPHNTLAIDATARYFVDIESAGQLPEAVAFARQKQLPLMILGQGSNVVFQSDFPGLVIHIALTGIEVFECGDSIELEVGAGENWHELVMFCARQGWWGIENLALIPGTVGAAPIQNIGAYGVELDRVLVAVSGWHIGEGQWKTLALAACQLGYRDSIFKRSLKDQFIVSGVRIRLARDAGPNIGYQPLAEVFAERENEKPTPLQVAEAVMAIRRSKLPDPAEVPNAGSFFKNPIVSAQKHAELLDRYPDLVSYPQSDGRFKLAAAWLIERAGWKGCGSKGGALKGMNENGVSMHDRQALVLVNRQGAGGDQLLAFADRVRDAVKSQFGVALEIEPSIY